MIAKLGDTHKIQKISRTRYFEKKSCNVFYFFMHRKGVFYEENEDEN